MQRFGGWHQESRKLPSKQVLWFFPEVYFSEHPGKQRTRIPSYSRRHCGGLMETEAPAVPQPCRAEPGTLDAASASAGISRN